MRRPEAAAVRYMTAEQMGVPGWYVLVTDEDDNGERFVGTTYGPYTSAEAGNAKAGEVLRMASNGPSIQDGPARAAHGSYRMQAIYQHADGRHVLYASMQPTADAMLIECVSEGLLPIIDIRPYGPMSGPAFDCTHDELNSPVEDRAAGAELQSRSRAREILASVYASTDALDRAIDTQWEVPSASGGTSHIVTVRPDTRFGGTYLHCDCIGWGPQRGRGRDCRHVTAVKNGEGLECL